MAKRKKKDEAPAEVEPTSGPGDVPWLQERISSVGTWHRNTGALVRKLSSQLKTAKAENREAADQLFRLSLELANARGEYDPAEVEAEKEGRPLLAACGVQGEPKPEAPAADPPRPLDWRDDVLYGLLKPLDADEGPSTALAVSHALEGRLGVDRAIRMDDLHRWFADGGRIVDLDALLSDDQMVALLDALDAWRKARTWHAGIAYPEGMPLEFVTRKFHGLEKAYHRVRSRAAKARKRAAHAAEKAEV